MANQCDYFGNELEIGDFVIRIHAYKSGGWSAREVYVVGFTKQMVKVSEDLDGVGHAVGGKRLIKELPRG